jgi:hypothetical protein
MNLTIVQKIALIIGVLGFTATAGTQLTDIFAPFGSYAPLIVKEIVSVAGFASGVLGIVLAFITGQANAVRVVKAMPGVEGITVNAQASQALAALAVDPNEAKINIVPGAQDAVAQTAKGAS